MILVASTGWMYKVVIDSHLPPQLDIRLSHCIECGAKLKVVEYIGAIHLKELVCPKCGLVHAIFGADFYRDVQNEIIEQLIKQQEKKGVGKCG
ncbi:hypothetical protein DRJ17_04580 [Candidatus Woesearchaeota archaeon]|nr:MAG: hypothetical protein DRJ17_04580 [Candidatus Woesearchaeota archaeon]